MKTPTIISLVVMSLTTLLFSCDKETPNDQPKVATYIRTSTSNMEFSNEYGSQTFEVISDGAWRIEVPDSAWCHLSAINGKGNTTVEVTVDHTLSQLNRSATIKLQGKSGGPSSAKVPSCELTITQNSLGNILRVDYYEIPYFFSAHGDVFKVKVLSNAKYTIERDEPWMACDTDTSYLEYGANVTIYNIRIPSNNATAPRNGVLTFKASSDTMRSVINLQQYGYGDDREVLESLSKAWGRPATLKNWGTATPLSQWTGVRANDAGGVIALTLWYRTDIKGVIPRFIGDLENLEVLHLSGDLKGSIPVEIGKLTKLKELRISSRDIFGEIPSSIGNLTNLHYLELDARLTGKIPAEIGNLQNLDTLDLGIGLSGSFPVELCSLSKLKFLKLWGNKLTGELPMEIGNLQNLEWLLIQRNSFTGTYPASIGSMSKLKVFNTEHNSFSGPIPDEIKNNLNYQKKSNWELCNQSGGWIEGCEDRYF